jgi:hypothetical protein
MDIKFKFANDQDYMTQDAFTSEHWFHIRENHMDYIAEVFDTTNTKKFVLEPYVRNVRVHDNIVFYINDRGEFRVKRLGTTQN